ncbi:MAG: UDP-N-acetylmuramoyl-L-alanyl-D-glutamate--2,6-diaminopimelate ligase [Pseudomonadota bacterium]
MITVRDLLAGVEVIESTVDLDAMVARVWHDSRQVTLGDAFVAIPGEKVHGDDYFAQARDRGAVLLVGTRKETLLPHPAWVLVADARRTLARLAHNAAGRPSDAATLVGITGTNGKTSTTWLLEAIARSAGANPGVVGTVNYRYAGRSEPATHTTPEAPVLQEILRTMVDAGCDTILMEVSSHALVMHRVLGCQWTVAAATNLSPEHLDYHETINEYGEAKARLFTELLPASRLARAAVLNIDDAWAASLKDRTSVEVLTVSLEDPGASVRVLESRVDADGIEASMDTPAGRLSIRSALGGRHNLSNIALAVGIACALDWPREAIEEGIRACDRIPGRMDPVPNDLGIHVWVDYAHTPDALENAVRAARSMTEGELWVVFGAGGDRDRTKRPLMGAAVARGADRSVVTSDNPRTEDPAVIIDDILKGIPESDRARVLVEVDRATAIRRALAGARSGDGVLVAGKGHETYVEVHGVRTHFDDREIASAMLLELAGGAHDA